MGKGGGGLKGDGRVRKHMLGQRSTLNESTTKSFEGLLVITFFFFLFVLFLLCFSWSSAIPIVLSVRFIWLLGSMKGLRVVLATSWRILPRK